MVDRIRSIRPRIPQSLRVRVALPFVALSAVVFSILYLFIGSAIEQNYIEDIESDLEVRAAVAALIISDRQQANVDQETLSNILTALASITETRMTLIDPDGNVLIDTETNTAQLENHNDRPEVQDAREDGRGAAQRGSDSTGETYLYMAVPVPEYPGLIIRLAVPVDYVDSYVGSVQRAILLAVVGSLVATLIASWYFAGRLAQPLEQLKMQAMRVAVGDYSVRVPHVDIDELNSVGRAFNRMAQRLEDVIDRQEQTSLRLESVMAGLIDGVILTDAEGLVLRVNAAAESMLGVKESEVKGRPFVQAVRDYEMARVLASAFDGKQNPNATIEHGVEKRAFHVAAKSIEGSQQELGLVVLRDVTEIRRLEAVRREFVANVSHELRTPLTSIRALVETLEAGAIEETEIAMEFLGRIIGEISRLNTLVEDLLDFARLEAGRTPLRLETVSVAEVVANGANRLQPQIERAGLSIRLELEEDLPEVLLDVGRIEQVLINLIHNAIKFTPAGGTLTLRAWREKNNVLVSLRDTGVGISEDEQARLFERFYKSDKARRSEGTGLGLAIAKNIVQLHGGNLGVESTVGEGSVFTFTLPLKRKKAAKRARKHALTGLV